MLFFYTYWSNRELYMDEVDNGVAGSKILVADDDIENTKFLVNLLSGSGYSVRSVLSGDAVLDLCEDDQPDLILLDINMPGMSGYEVCKRIKAREDLKDICIIFISGISDPKEKVEAFKCGGVDYLTKPIHIEELNSRIKNHLEIKHSRQTIAQYVDQLRNTIDDMSALFETGTLVANVVHDTKKFISAMSMMIEAMIIPQLKEKLDESEEWVKETLFDLEEVYENSLQCSEFLESLLSINRKNDGVEPVDIRKTIQQAVNLISYNMMQDGIQWEIECDSEKTLMVNGNGQLVRVFMNLIVNAVDALKKQETVDPLITIRIEEIEKDIKIQVIDNGMGIKKEVLEGIRKGMVLSTKGKAGNGFGVSGLTKIVKSLNGTIDIESVVGKGATFIVTLEKFVGELEDL
jgi:two-component system NtrC family sensor kinase